VQCVAGSGQVLVLHDMLAVSHGKRPRFVHNFMDDSASVQCAVPCSAVLRRGRESQPLSR